MSPLFVLQLSLYAALYYSFCHCCCHCQSQFAFCHNLITTVIMITIAPGPGRPRQGYSGQSSSTFSMPFLTFSLYQCSTFTFSLSTFSPLVFLDVSWNHPLYILTCLSSQLAANWFLCNFLFHCLLIFPGWSVCSKTGLCPLF